jgi:hypothetical protein
VAWLEIGQLLHGIRHQRERPHHPRSCGTPPGPEARDSGVHSTTTGRHRTSILEQMF